MRKALICCIVTLVTLVANAQKYTTAGGIRVGSGIGITVQQHLWDKFTLEGIAQKNLFKDGTNVTALFESHYKILAKGLNFYIGAGPHFGFYSQEKNYTVIKDNQTIITKGMDNAIGLSGVAGLEMRFNRLLLSFDYQPGLNFHGGPNTFTSQTGISARYIFIKDRRKQKKNEGNWKFWEKLGQHPDGDDD